MLDCNGDASPLGAMLEFAQNQNWQILPALDARATPSGTVNDDVLEIWWAELKARWQHDCDALFLVLHGAMVEPELMDLKRDGMLALDMTLAAYVKDGVFVPGTVPEPLPEA